MAEETEKNANPYEYHASDVITLKLSDFEGPLDLLCHLIKDNEMDIRTCRISDITQQYMDYMAQIGTVDMDTASDFLVMAATLLEIKSKVLLPREKEYFEEEEEYNPEEELRRQIMIFQMFKEQADKMAKIEVLNQFYVEPKYTMADADIVIKSFDFDMLIDAYGQVLLKFTQEQRAMAQKKIKKDKFTVTEKITLISNVLQEKKQVKFSELFKEDSSRVEIITTFQALLELMKKQFLTAKQEAFNEDILLTINEDVDGKQVDLSELTKTEDKYD